MNLAISLILIISIDTLRLDAVEPGYMPSSCTHLGSFQHVRQCWTPVPLTLPAHVSMLNGQYPHEHGIRNNGNYRLSDDSIYLPQLLHDRGFQTAAFVSSKVLSAKYGLGRGFDLYLEPSSGHSDQPAETTIGQCLEYLRKEPSKPRLVFLHLYDPHAPYKGYGQARPNSREAYYAEARYVDWQLDKVWTFLDEQKAWPSSIVVFTSDHGEDLGDHGEFQHGQYLYNSTMRVPLFLHAPVFRTPGEMTVRKTGSLVDLAPTILHLLGIDKPAGMTGNSLLDPGQSPCFLESMAPFELMRWPRMFGVIAEGWKYIEGDTVECYNLREEVEKVNHAATQPAKIQRFASLLGPLKKSVQSPAKGDPELLALGYLSPVSNGEIRTIARSDQRKVLEALHNCYLAMDAGSFAEIWDTAQNALAVDPDNPALHFYLLVAATWLNRQLPEAMLALLKPEIDRSGATAYMLGQYFEKNGASDKAKRLYLLSQQQNPLFIEPALSLMMLALTRGRTDEARSYVELLRRHGRQEEAGILAESVWLFHKGNPHYALLFLDKAGKELGDSVRYWVIKGYVQSTMNMYEAARTSFQRAHALGFMSPEFLLAWATITLETNDWTEARQLFTEFIRRYPQHKETANVREILETSAQH